MRINMAGNVFLFLTAPIGFATVLLLRGRVEGSFDMGLALGIPVARKVCHRDMKLRASCASCASCAADGWAVVRLLEYCLHDTVGVIFVGSMAETNAPSRHRETCMHRQAYHDDRAVSTLYRACCRPHPAIRLCCFMGLPSMVRGI